MNIRETPIQDVVILEPKMLEDKRGFFCRGYCRDFFESNGLNSNLPQTNFAMNTLKGTLRGMHYQSKPFPETKVVQCIKGAVYDVVIDLRPQSPTFKKWFGLELNEKNHFMLYIGHGIAHGYQTLCDDTELLYLMGESYHPECSRGVRYDDPSFSIEWPLPISIISEKDCNFMDFQYE